MLNKIVIPIMLCFLLAPCVLGAVTYTWSNDTQNLFVQGVNEDNITFEDVYNGGQILPENLKMPRIYGMELTENNSAEWQLYASDNTSRFLGNVSGISLTRLDVYANNYSVNVSFNGTGNKSIGWNTNHSYINTNYGDTDSLAINVMNTLNVRMKSSNTSINLTDIRLRCDGGDAPLIRQEYYGRRSNISKVNIDNETWVNITLYLKEDLYAEVSGTPHFITGETVYDYRFYWDELTRIYFSFEGGDDGDYVLIDDLHFESGDLRPEKIGYKTYDFKTPTSIETNFYDYDFTVIFSNLGAGVYGARDVYFYPLSGETITLGMPRGLKHDRNLGGNFIFVSETSGKGGFDVSKQIKFAPNTNSKVNINNIRFYGQGESGIDDYYWGAQTQFQFSGDNNEINFYNTEFYKTPDFVLSDYGNNNHANIIDVAVHGARYPLRIVDATPDKYNFDGFASIGATYSYGYFNIERSILKGLKYVYDSNNPAGATKSAIYTRDYGYPAGQDNNITLINPEFDFTNAFGRANINCDYTANDCNLWFASEVNIKTVDNNGSPIVLYSLTNSSYVSIKTTNGLLVDFIVTDRSIAKYFCKLSSNS